MSKLRKKYKKLVREKRKKVYAFFIRHNDIVEIAKICEAKPVDVYGMVRFLRRAVKYLNWYRQNKGA